MKNFVRCCNIFKTFGKGENKVEALKNIDLEINENECVMIMGPSGSGKTTLLSIIGGILKQDSGDCFIIEKNIQKLSSLERTKFRSEHIGFVFQQINLIPTLTSLENVAIPLILNNIERKKSFEIARNFLSKIGLEKKLYRYPKELSGGEQQRVSIIRACIHKPSVILCDEPTSFLDFEKGKEVMNLLKSIQKEHNSALVIVTHDPRIINYATRLVYIEDGKIVKKSN